MFCYFCEQSKPATGTCCRVVNWRAAEIANGEFSEFLSKKTYREAKPHLRAAIEASATVTVVRAMVSRGVPTLSRGVPTLRGWE